MSRRPPRSTRTDTLFPYTTLFRSLFAWYDYELLVPAELQALAAFEMAIQMKLRAIGHEMKGTMHNLIEKGRKCGIIPPIAPGTVSAQDPVEALVKIRNRSEERRVGKECGSTCRSRWSPYHKKKEKK